jgi:hypothetical protein
MWVLVIYVLLMTVGSLVDVAIGGIVSREWSDAASLPIFLGSYFVTLAGTWVIAVKIAERLKLYN